MNTAKQKIANPFDENSVSMTLFIPLCPKALETKRNKNG
jgi:hypothetical protein